METTFEAELPGNNNVILTVDQRPRFYETMKQVVVVIESKLKSSPMVMIGAGVIVDERGYILTTAHVVDGYDSVRFRRVNDNCFFKVEVIARKSESDLALLKSITDDSMKFDYAKFGDEEFMRVGMETISIGHPHRLFYSFVIGHMAYPCNSSLPPHTDPPLCQTPLSRVVEDFYDESEESEIRESCDAHILRMGKAHVIQLANLHGGQFSWGAPIFDSHGRVIGIHSFILKRHDFAIALGPIKSFCLHHFSEEGKKKRRKSAKRITGGEGKRRS